MRRRAKGLPALEAPRTPCVPSGSLALWDRCQHPRSCACGAALHLAPSFEVPGCHTWQWMDQDGRQGVSVYPWGLGPCPDGWWTALAQKDVAAYSALSARDGLGMLAQYHRHAPVGPCAVGGCQSAAAPECHGKPMLATVEGWRCRESLLVLG